MKENVEEDFNMWLSCKKYDEYLRDSDEYYQMQTSFYYDCEIEHEVLCWICSKCKFNVKDKIYREFLKEMLSCHCWRLGPYQACEFWVGIGYLLNYCVFKACEVDFLRLLILW